MRRRWPFVVVSAAAITAGVVGACSFPDPTFLPEGESEGGRDGGSDGNRDGRPIPDGPTNRDDSGEILIDGSTPDALIAKDAGQKVDASGCLRCDCDDDGYNETTKPSCNTGPRDCDDYDSRAHPGQDYVDQLPDPNTKGDWNCDGTTVPLYSTNVSCAGLALLGCADVSGFEDNPSCGQTGSYITCKVSLLTCVVDKREPRKQACQ